MSRGNSKKYAKIWNFFDIGRREQCLITLLKAALVA